MVVFVFLFVVFVGTFNASCPGSLEVRPCHFTISKSAQLIRFFLISAILLNYFMYSYLLSSLVLPALHFRFFFLLLAFRFNSERRK